MRSRNLFWTGLLILLSTATLAGETKVRVVQCPDSAAGNDHYTGNRAPLLPSWFIALPPGSVQPRGWLHKQLRLQADGFHGHLDEISQYLRKEGNAWLDPQGRGHHGWEELPYWLKGYGNLAYILGDEAMIAEAKVWINGAINSQQEDGWFGPDRSRAGAATSLQGRDDLWPNMIMLFCLQDYYGFSGDQRVPALMTRYFRYLHENVPPDKLLNGYWPVMRGGDLLYSVYWLYNRNGNAWLLDVAEKVHADTARWDEDVIDWHNVNFAQGFGEPATYYLQSHDPKDLEAAYRNLRKMRGIYGQIPGGMYGADERARPGYRGPRQGIETCGIVEQMLSDEIILQISGDPFWADHCETVALNTFPAALTADLKSLRYLTAPNQVLCDAAEKKPAVQIGSPVFLYSPHQHRCCQHNWGHGWPYYARHLWLAAPGNGLAVGMYAASKVTAKVGDGQSVSIVETTHYPFDETMTLAVETDRAVRFPLYLRIPTWCDQARLTLNGSQLDVEPPAGKYVVIERTWSSGDKIVLTFPMAVRVKEWKENHGFVSVHRGPLTYSLQIGENYVRHGGTDKWPEWEVYPASEWNYGLVLDPANPAGSFEVSRRQWPDSDMPFTHEGTPIKLQARARKIPSWNIDGLGMVGRIQESPAYSVEPLETVTLIPMGAARLRLSAFPVVSTSPEANKWRPPEGMNITGLEAHMEYYGEPVTLQWKGTIGACEIRRDGTVIAARHRGSSYGDFDAPVGKKCTYTVKPVGGMKSATVTITTKEFDPNSPLPHVRITRLKPLKATTGYGSLTTGKSVSGEPLRLSGKTYFDGIGMHANGELVYACKPEWKQFVATVGVDDKVRSDPRPSIVCHVIAEDANGKKQTLAKSPTLKSGKQQQYDFDVSLPKDCIKLHLVVDDAGDGISCDHADWVNAGFRKK